MGVSCLIVFCLCSCILMRIDQFHVPRIGLDTDRVFVFLEYDSRFFFAISSLEVVYFASFKVFRRLSIGFIDPGRTVLHKQAQLSFESIRIVLFGVGVNGQTSPQGISCPQSKVYLAVFLRFGRIYSSVKNSHIPFDCYFLCACFCFFFIYIEVYFAAFRRHRVVLRSTIVLDGNGAASFDRDG